MKIIVMHLSQTDPIDFLDGSSAYAVGELINSGLHGLLNADHAISPFQLLRAAIAGAGWKHTFSSQELPKLLDLLNDESSLLGIDLAFDDLNRAVASVLETIEGEAVILALSAIDASGSRAFVMTTTQGFVAIQLDDVRGEDLVATILELAGFDSSSTTFAGACSLVSLLSETAGSVDDEELVRERLRGLGYIA